MRRWWLWFARQCQWRCRREGQLVVSAPSAMTSPSLPVSYQPTDCAVPEILLCVCNASENHSTPLSSAASELRGQGGHCTPQVQELYPLYPPTQRCGLCQNFKLTTLTTRLYKVRTNLYSPPLTKTLPTFLLQLQCEAAFRQHR